MSRFTAVMVVAASVATTTLSAQTDSLVARAIMPAPWSPTVIEPDSLDRAAFTNLGELLQARVPGLSVTRRGDGGTVIHLRGPSTVLADNAPLLVVDGIRISLRRNRLEEFEGRPGPLDDIDVEQIERVEILSGPAVAAMYGTGAANGVIRISTREARATPRQWRLFTAAGRVAETGEYPSTFFRLGTTSVGESTATCTRVFEAKGACTPSGPLTSLNPLEDEGVVRPASLVRAGGSVSAGTDLLAWTAGSTFEHVGSVTDQVRTRRLHHRGAVRARISTGASLTLRGHWMDGATPLLTSQWLRSLRGQALLGFWTPDTWQGFMHFPEPERHISRRGVSLHADWQASGWLRGSVLAGMDYSSGTDRFEFTYPVDTRTYTTSEYVRQRRNDFTARAEVEGVYQVRTLRARTTALLDLVEHRRNERFEGRTTSSDGLSASGMMAMRRQQSTTGLALVQEFAAGDRAALRLGIRREDLGSGVPTGWKTPWYPQASLAIVAARERPGLLNGLRLHVAYGKAGALPVVDALFAQPPGAGSGQSEAEQTTEREAGFDASWLNRRADLAMSWYSRRSTGVLLPSSRGGYVAREVLNRGIEVSLRARVLDIPRARWDIRAGFAHNHNEARGGSQYLLSEYQWIFEGAPLGAYQRFPVISATDIDGDGVLENACIGSGGCEVVYGTEREYVSAAPPTELSLDNDFRFGPLGVTFLLDHRRGHFLHNQGEEYRCLRGRCGDAYASSLSLEDAIRQASVGVLHGAFLEDATFTRLRELSIRVDAPRTWARGLGGSRLQMSIAGRNLATWTDYTGMDPEAGSSGDNSLLVSDFGSAPVPRSVSLRLTLVR